MVEHTDLRIPGSVSHVLDVGFLPLPIRLLNDENHHSFKSIPTDPFRSLMTTSPLIRLMPGIGVVR